MIRRGSAAGSISNRPTSCPRRRIGCATVVSSAARAAGMSSNPHTDTSPGTESPRSVNVDKTPSAITSLSPTTAVGSGPDSTRWFAALAPEAWEL